MKCIERFLFVEIYVKMWYLQFIFAATYLLAEAAIQYPFGYYSMR